MDKKECFGESNLISLERILLEKRLRLACSRVMISDFGI